MSAQKKTYSPKNTDFAGDTAIAAGYANHWEEANHLGNVLAVVSDRKIAVEDQGNPGTVEYYEADIVSAQDYYPFGMIMPGRSVSAGEYRYGFGGQEMDNEISGTGNSYTAEYWQYDSRLGRRWNLDPVKVYFESGYVTFRNNPVVLDDPDGDCAGCDFNYSVGASYSLSGDGGGSFSFSAGTSVSYGQSAGDFSVEGDVGVAANLYVGGIGTTQGTSGNAGFQADFVGTMALTAGVGEGDAMPRNTFNSMTKMGMTDEFGFSATASTNQVLNTDGRHQRVGSVGLRAGDFNVHKYNDFFPGLGDRDDRFWTGGTEINYSLGGGEMYSLGHEVFTGERMWDEGLGMYKKFERGGNTYYQQTETQRNLNNGQTYLNYTTDTGVSTGYSISGSNMMYFQNAIHDRRKDSHRFESGATNQIQSGLGISF